MNATPLDPLIQLSQMVQWFTLVSLQHFVPELVLGVGFLLSLLIDAATGHAKNKRGLTLFAVLVIAVAGVLAGLDWQVADPQHPDQGVAAWQIFPMTQTLFTPDVDHGRMSGGYGMVALDNFATFFKLLSAASGILVLLMSLASSELRSRAARMGEYSSLILGMMVGLFLMPAATDLVPLYISLELVSISGYVLAGFSKNSEHGAEASLKYILYGALASGLMLYGFSLFYGLTGTTNIVAIRQAFAAAPATHTGMNMAVVWTATILTLVGMGYKISAVPFHNWTPDVYEGAPTPVTALLSVASKAAGFGVLIRFLILAFPLSSTTGAPLIAWPIVIAGLSALTMTIGNLAALQQSNVRRMLAYSSIAHAGYVLAGLAVGGGAGIVAIMVYLVAYVFMQLGAFYAVMLIENRIKSEEIDDYRGLMMQAPLVSSAMVIFLISLTGIPLTAGFIGKFYLFTALLQPMPGTHDVAWLWLAIVMVLNSIISLYYYLRVAGALFLKRPLRELATGSAEAPADVPTIAYPLPAAALLVAFVIPVILLGVYFQPLVDFAGGVVHFFGFHDIRF